MLGFYFTLTLCYLLASSVAIIWNSYNRVFINGIYLMVYVNPVGDRDGDNPTDVTTIIMMSDETTTDIMTSVVSSK